MNFNFPPNNKTPQSEEEKHIKDLGLKVSECIFGQYTFTVLGVIAGTAFTLKKKTVRHFVLGSIYGTLADMGFGYCVRCRDHITAFDEAKRDYEWKQKALKELNTNNNANNNDDGVSKDS